MENGFKRDLQNYPLYFLLWTVLGLFYFSQGLTQRLVWHDPTPWWHYLVAWLSGVYIWALLTPAILWLSRQFLERRNWFPRIALHLLLSAGFSAFELSLKSALYSRLHLFPLSMKDFRGTLVQLLVMGFHGGVLNYWIVLGVQSGILYYRRYQERSREVLQFELRASELQSQLMSARLNALKMQLQPHFLFNVLNAITVLVGQQKGKDHGRKPVESERFTSELKLRPLRENFFRSVFKPCHDVRARLEWLCGRSHGPVRCGSWR